jgi:hypothetical protein
MIFLLSSLHQIIMKLCVETVDLSRDAGEKVTHVPKCNKWKHADMKKHLLQFYALRSNSLRKFHKDHLATTNIPRNTFQRHWREINLKSLQEKNGDVGIAKAAVENYLARTDKNKSTRVAGAIESRRYLSVKEEEALVHLALFLGTSGHGIDKGELLAAVNAMINLDFDERERVEASEKTVRCVLERHPDLMKLVNSGALDPARARKATKKTRNIAFAKLQAQTRGLHCQGKIPWKDCRDIPPECIHNMDEVGSDPTKHRRKIVGDKQNVSRAFTITPEGDRMNGHVTVCVATRADGTLTLML